MRQIEKHPMCELMACTSGREKLAGVYRVLLGKRQAMSVWIVDRDKIVRSLYPEFIMGGNDQRYRFNPLNEVWIDSNIGVEELEYTIAHELIERRLMLERGWSYNRAHSEGGLATEKRMRENNERRVLRKARSVHQLCPRDGSRSAGGRLVDPVCLADMYRGYIGTRDGVSAWIVDGPKVRKDLYGDFCYGTHDLKAGFVPEREIWIDSAMSVLEVHYTVRRNRLERKLLSEGIRWAKAYDLALSDELHERDRQARLVVRHEDLLAPVDLGVRDKGAKRKP